MGNTIFFKPAPQIENTGDQLINKAELSLLRTYGTVIIDDTKTPDWFLEDIVEKGTDVLLSSISNKQLHGAIAEYIAKLNRSNVRDEKVILFIHPGHRSRKGIKSALKTLYSGFRDSKLKTIGCGLVRVGFSIGPYDKINGYMDAMASRHYDYFGLRDNKSIKLAKDLKFSDPQYFPDLAWAYLPTLDVKKVDKEDYIILSLRSNQYGEHHSESYLKPVADKLLEMLTLAGNKSKILVTYQVKYDRAASIYLTNLLSQKFDAELIDYKLSLSQAEDLYSKAKCVISNRLHVLLLGFQCNTLSLPFIIPDDNKKIVGIYSDNKMEYLMLNSNSGSEGLSNQFRGLLKSSEQLVKEFYKTAEVNTDLINKKLDLIINQGQN